MGGEILPGHQAVLVDVALLGDPLPHDPVEVGNDHIAWAAFRRPHQGAGGVGRDPVVAVQKLEIGPPGPVQSEVPALGNAGVFLMDDLNAAVSGRVLVADGAGTIRASVVYQQQLKIRVLLVQDTFDAAADGMLRVVDRDDDTDGGTHRHAPFGKIVFALF